MAAEHIRIRIKSIFLFSFAALREKNTSKLNNNTDVAGDIKMSGGIDNTCTHSWECEQI